MSDYLSLYLSTNFPLNVETKMFSEVENMAHACKMLKSDIHAGEFFEHLRVQHTGVLFKYVQVQRQEYFHEF